MNSRSNGLLDLVWIINVQLLNPAAKVRLDLLHVLLGSRSINKVDSQTRTTKPTGTTNSNALEVYVCVCVCVRKRERERERERERVKERGGVTIISLRRGVIQTK